MTDTLEQAQARQREQLLNGNDYGLDREQLTELLLNYSLCPVHRVDYAICFDDRNPGCEQVRAVHPAHDI